ncbi:hypothetical protein VTN02DRAFT_6418 [Thermoascus thermophilus]
MRTHALIPRGWRPRLLSADGNFSDITGQQAAPRTPGLQALKPQRPGDFLPLTDAMRDWDPLRPRRGNARAAVFPTVAPTPP